MDLERERVVSWSFTAEQYNALIREYEGGMTRSNVPRCHTLSDELGIPLSCINNWIGNYRRKVQNKPRKKRNPPLFVKGPTSYNLFCKKKRISGNNAARLKGWKEGWDDLPTVEKNALKEEAKQQKDLDFSYTTEKERSKAVGSILGQIGLLVNKLHKLNHETAAVIVSEDLETFYHIGSPRGKVFLDKKNVDEAFRSSLRDENTEDREALRKEVRKLINDEYKKISGAEHVPYKYLLSGQSSIRAQMPEGLELKNPSDYGLPALKTILETGISFVQDDVQQVAFEVDDPILQETEARVSIQHTVPDLEPPVSNILTASENGGPVTAITPLTYDNLQEMTVEMNGSVTKETPPAASAHGTATDPTVTDILTALANGGPLPPMIPVTHGKPWDKKRKRKQSPSSQRVKRKITAPKRYIENDASSQGAFPQREVDKKGGKEKKKASTTESEKVYVIDRVIKHRRIKGRKQCLVKWRGYGEEEATWEPYDDLYRPN